MTAKPVVGGAFTMIGGVAAKKIAWWDGATWHPFGGGLGGPGGSVDGLAVYEGDLIAAGGFSGIGGQPCGGLARWDGTTWHDFSQNMDSPDDIMVHDGDLYASGPIPNGQWGVSRYEKGGWHALMSTVYPNGAYALAAFRGDIIAGGDFNYEGGRFILRWDGAAWTTMGQGLNATVTTLTTWDPDGPGPLPDRLIAGGYFSQAWGGGPALMGVASWDGTQWSPLGSGLNARATSLTTWNDQLVVGGSFSTAGGTNSSFFARYGCAPCEADCNGDGVLSLADFGCFQTRFAVANMQADCNRDGVLQLSDFGCFQTNFALGCP